MDMSEAILRGNFETFGNLVGKSWIQNQALDSGTNPPAVAAIIEQIKDYTLGYKLPVQEVAVTYIWWLKIRKRPDASVGY